MESSKSEKSLEALVTILTFIRVLLAAAACGAYSYFAYFTQTTVQPYFKHVEVAAEDEKKARNCYGFLVTMALFSGLALLHLIFSPCGTNRQEDLRPSVWRACWTLLIWVTVALVSLFAAIYTLIQAVHWKDLFAQRGLLVESRHCEGLAAMLITSLAITFVTFAILLITTCGFLCFWSDVTDLQEDEAGIN